MPRPPAWSARDDARLREMWTAGVPVAEIVAALDGDRTRNAVACRAENLRIRRPKGFRRHVRSDRWTNSDIAILREMYAAGRSIAEIVSALDREATEYMIWTKACELGIRRPRGATCPPRKPDGPRFEFTDDDEEPPVPERAARTFSKIENRRIRRFFARGDSIDDVARQMRCQVADIEALGFRF